MVDDHVAVGGAAGWPKNSGANRLLLPVMITPRKAWKEIVAKSTTSSTTGGQRLGPGSVPMSTQVKR